MKESTLKRVSLLSLVLIAASAVTAAIMPATKESKDNQVNGGLVRSSGEVEGPVGLSCIQSLAQECNWTDSNNGAFNGESDTSSGAVNTNDSSTDNALLSTSAGLHFIIPPYNRNCYPSHSKELLKSNLALHCVCSRP